MTTPSIEELIAASTQTNQLHEDADICTADIINVLQSQAERIKELESECLNSDIRLATVIEQREKLRAQLAKELPVLPEPCIYEGNDSPLYDTPTGYTADQLQAYGAACAAHARDVALEECVQICHKHDARFASAVPDVLNAIEQLKAGK